VIKRESSSDEDSTDLWKTLRESDVEFDPTQPPRLNERVLKDKRKKLRETFDRVINMYVSISAVNPWLDFTLRIAWIQTRLEKYKNQMI